MSQRWIGIILMIVGLVAAVVSILADAIGIGDSSGFGPNQVLGLVAGLFVLAVGAFLYVRARRAAG